MPTSQPLPKVVVPPYDKNNVFARILRGEMPFEWVYGNQYVMAFRDIAPVAKVHVLVVPRGAYVNYHDFIENAPANEQLGFWKAVDHVARELGLAENGWRMVANTGKDAGQVVPHFHIHILGGEPLGPMDNPPRQN
ncbi:HIT domain-containing protein [Formicincola oecophyllae]|uniref:HIT domain-containing protein n=1 Tax=Formicincola oecophyllae TaxID=2558361 RepID=A0A4Y6U751_9PROT|nr:HIT domain-containing protein [Formicincola oecophyllae]QDH13209.1 HIT domain-containing protein [Formicincola oecophyllae]